MHSAWGGHGQPLGSGLHGSLPWACGQQREKVTHQQARLRRPPQFSATSVGWLGWLRLCGWETQCTLDNQALNFTSLLPASRLQPLRTVPWAPESNSLPRFPYWKASALSSTCRPPTQLFRLASKVTSTMKSALLHKSLHWDGCLDHACECVAYSFGSLPEDSHIPQAPEVWPFLKSPSSSLLVS